MNRINQAKLIGSDVIKKITITRGLSGVLLLLAVTVLPIPVAAGGKENRGITKCDIHHVACVQTLAQGTVTLNILPKPVKAMADLTFQVAITGVPTLQNPFIDLSMPGMYMGPNHVTLEPVSPGKYEGTGIFVRCPTGITLWRATVTIPEKGTAHFIFDVIY
ncbi:FixH family protein [bacterium]|nr:FixH family protein [bacterium]